jgi:hypothetical protein
MDIQDLLDDFTNGDFDRWLNYFGDYKTFFRFLDKRGLLVGNDDPSDDIDPRDDIGGEWANYLMLYLNQYHPEKYKEYIKLMLSDVQYIDDRPYLVCDKEDLASLFCDNRREGLSRDTIEQILSGEGPDWDRYWDTTENVYRDVIEELTPENLKTLSEYIVTELKGKKIFPETEELESIASEQGHPEYLEINSENVMRIIDDEESMKELLGDQLSHLRGELYSIHSIAYNSAYESMIYNSINSELGKFFDMDNAKWGNTPHPFKKDTYIETWNAPIYNFDSNIMSYLEDNKNYGSRGTLEYWGKYLDVLKAYIDDVGDCLDASVSDYPDFREVDKNINIYFKEQF